MLIYTYTNSINGKKYVGLTRSGLAKRHYQHLYAAFVTKTQYTFHKALRKYGPDAFGFPILVEKCDTLEQLKTKEIYWIQHFDSYKFGYNMTPGGDAPIIQRGKKQSPEWVKKRTSKLVGRSPSKESIEKNRISNCKTHYKLTYPDGRIVIIVGLKKFCREHNINMNSLQGTLRYGKPAKRGHCLGMLLERI